MSNSRNNFQFLNNPLAIRQEIQRFESVHPSIYAIYDLIELIPDQQIAQQIRDHVVCIEDSFVNSQEWTLSRSVPELRIGIVGSINSGKSALVHRYLTGSYMQEESPEGGRFKKEVFIDSQSYLLLIRDEGGLPEMQFAAWVDAVIFVFSLENESSFNAVYNFFTKMSHFRNSADIPIILVGTQDAINEKNPRVIDETRARKLATDLKGCSYYETCATYGLNVETVFQDGKYCYKKYSTCHKVAQYRKLTQCRTPSSSRPATPLQESKLGGNYSQIFQKEFDQNLLSSNFESNVRMNSSSMNNTACCDQNFLTGNNSSLPPKYHMLSASSHHIPSKPSTEFEYLMQTTSNSPAKNWNSIKSSHGISQQTDRMSAPLSNLCSLQSSPSTTHHAKDTKELTTPTSTPTTSRKSRRRSNLFIPSSKKSEIKLSELGSGRAIPIKQGYLYKRSSNSLNKEWKKKYVTLCSDGRLTYHSSLHDYMDEIHGKEIALNCVTIKLPGQRPRGSKSILTNSTLSSFYWKATNNVISDGVAGITSPKDRKSNDFRESIGKTNNPTSGDEGVFLSTSNSQTFIPGEGPSLNSNVKKRHRRIKSSVTKNELDDGETFEFCIVSLEGKQWQFEAATFEERDEWVHVIEQEIFKSLQSNVSTKSKPQTSNYLATIQMIKERVDGNRFCADCEAKTPEWASLNLGILICIECSGIHRNLGSHISKVRSIGLDELQTSHLSVMLSIGNAMSNSIFEANTQGFVKPNPQSSREEKESWIRRKYESKDFVPDFHRPVSCGKLLIEAVVRSDIRSIIITLLHSSVVEINSTVSERDLRTALHFAAAMGNLPVVQILIWNHANLEQTDHEGRTCLSYAKAALSLSSTHLTNEPTKTGVNACLPLDTIDTTRSLIDLLIELGCPEGNTSDQQGTLSRRRDMLKSNVFEKLPSSVI